MSVLILDKICDDDDIADLFDLIKRLQAERDKYKEALEWYADQNNYVQQPFSQVLLQQEILEDFGDKAREALGK